MLQETQIATLSQPIRADLTSPIANASQENCVISPMSLVAIDSQGGLSSGRYFKKGLENDTSALPAATMKDSENVMAELRKHDIMARPQTQDGANGRRRFRVGAVTHK